MQALGNFLWNLGPWNWFILAVAMLLLETVVPGVHFMWFGLAAVSIGVLALILPIAWQWQLIAFAILSLIAILWIRRYWRSELIKTDEPDLNIRGAQYIGRVVTIEEAITGGRGKIRVGDTLWQAKGGDMPAGTRVKITGSDGTVLIVERETA